MAIACVMAVGPGEGHRYLDRTLRLAAGWAEKLIVYADGVDPDTFDSLYRLKRLFVGGSRLEVGPDNGIFRESLVRNRLLDLCDEKLTDGDLIIVLDADEELRAPDGSKPNAALQALRQQPGPFSVKVLHLWNPSGSEHRVDRMWQMGTGWRGYIHHRDLPRHPDADLACAPIPVMPRTVMPPVLHIAHWGYARPHDVARKHAYYMDRDGGRFHNLDHLRSIVEEPTLEPVPCPS